MTPLKSLDAKKTEKKLLVLDSDETLAHSRHERYGEEADLTFTLVEEGCIYFVKLRPGVRSFLEKAAKMIEVIIFTASDKEYADEIIDFLDPARILMSRGVYQDSLLKDGGYVKDLSIFGHDLAKIAIIDNCPHNFQMQKDNGIPITSWYVDPNDRELYLLLPFLEGLVAVKDVRPLIAERFGSYKAGSSKNKKVSAAESLVKPMENLKCKGRDVRSTESKVHKRRTAGR